MTKIGVLVSLFLYIIDIYGQNDDILGCGGFVKSDVEINFSVIEVKLYTSQGALKYSTDCAPHNGYYMIPIYDKGSYVLKVAPPPGWTFEPDSVDLLIDGLSDKCSMNEDINFQFTGFGVVGKVISTGHQEGPEGVTLSLINQKTNIQLKQVISEENGKYTFEKVLPGSYDITASHPHWIFEKHMSSVIVGIETGVASSDIIVSGYDVIGEVISDGEAIKGVNFLLFSNMMTSDDISHCDKSSIQGYQYGISNPPLCHVSSKENGKFIFPAVPSGEYIVVPFYKGDYITFDVVPAQLAFTVLHGSVILPETFQVAGFSVKGKVLNEENGAGLANAIVIVNGKQITTTSADGSYHLDSMKIGSYDIEIEFPHMFFDITTVKVTPNTPHLPDIVVSKFQICGKVIIDRMPDGITKIAHKRQIAMSIKGEESSSIRSVTINPNGQFCVEVTPATYILEVILTDDEKKAGLKLLPGKKEITVSNSPILDVLFSQFRARVTGTIQCLETCGMVQLSLSSLSRSEEKLTTHAVEMSKGASFIFEDVLPGKYKVSLHQELWCWKEKSIEIEVLDVDVKDVIFTQTGYFLTCSLSHDIILNFRHESNSETRGSFNLMKGVNKFCLAEPGVYVLEPQSCHQFEQQLYKYDTSSPTVLSLSAVRHLVEGIIVTSERQPDIAVSIKSLSNPSSTTTIDNLLSNKEPITTEEEIEGTSEMEGTPEMIKTYKTVEQEGPFQYSFSYWGRSGEKLEASATSSKLLFYPELFQVIVQGDTCPGAVIKLEGKQGLFIEGEINPPLEGVKIFISIVKDTEEQLMDIMTDENGKFVVGPLHDNIQYAVKAEKDGYILTPVDDKLGHFKAFKLGQIIVKVTDEADNSHLQGVLLSLSGEKQYRSNKQTLEDGSLSFTGLTPGQYFLRPMMKEYKFHPSSQMIDVLEGSSIEIGITGTRIAFSCYGIVTSLNGEPESGIVIEAIGKDEDRCSQYHEEGKTDQEGQFRIRGLQPSCVYEIKLKAGEANHHIERTTPTVKIVEVFDQDIKNIHIIAFRKINQMSISGNVKVDPQFLPSLKISFHHDLGESSEIVSSSRKLREISTVSLGGVVFFYLPSIALDNKKYLVRLESSLSRSLYDYELPECYFSANKSHKHISFVYNPKPKLIQQEISQTTFLVIPVVLIAFLLAYHHQQWLPMFTQGISVISKGNQSKQSSAYYTHSQETGSDLSSLDSNQLKKRKIRKT